MVAVGIVAMFMTIAIPTLFRSMNENSMRYASERVMELCRDARARAILDGKPMEFQIHGQERAFSISAAALPAPEADNSGEFGLGGGRLPGREHYVVGDRMRSHASSGEGGPSSYKLGQNIIIDELWVTGGNITGVGEGRVRFYPNGTADSMVLALRSLSDNEKRTFTVEEVTGLVEMRVEGR